MDEKIYKMIEETMDTYDCRKCLWHKDCGDGRDEDGTCSFFTSYSDSVDELDEDERSYFDELAQRQRAYAAVIASFEE